MSILSDKVYLIQLFWFIFHNLLRLVYTEELPGVAAHDSLFVLLHW